MKKKDENQGRLSILKSDLKPDFIPPKLSPNSDLDLYTTVKAHLGNIIKNNSNGEKPRKTEHISSDSNGENAIPCDFIESGSNGEKLGTIKLNKQERMVPNSADSLAIMNDFKLAKASRV